MQIRLRAKDVGFHERAQRQKVDFLWNSGFIAILAYFYTNKNNVRLFWVFCWISIAPGKNQLIFLDSNPKFEKKILLGGRITLLLITVSGFIREIRWKITNKFAKIRIHYITFVYIICDIFVWNWGQEF